MLAMGRSTYASCQDPTHAAQQTRPAHYTPATQIVAANTTLHPISASPQRPRWARGAVRNRGRLVFLLYNKVLQRGFSDIGELMPGYRGNICEGTRNNIYLAFAFVVLHLALSSTEDIGEVGRMGMTHMDCAFGESAARYADLVVLKQLLARLLALPFDRECAGYVVGHRTAPPK